MAIVIGNLSDNVVGSPTGTNFSQYVRTILSEICNFNSGNCFPPT